MLCFFFFQAEDGIRDLVRSRGLGDVYKRQEEKLPVPEEFRYLPFLVYDENTDGSRAVRCTACGICSKVCPPQCISIVRSSDPVTGKPVASPAEFYIDVDICMNCGFCAEFCPFDAIRMDHDYEVASVDRIAHHIFDLNRLLKPASVSYTHLRAHESVLELVFRLLL